MAPQPLSRVKANATVILDPFSIKSRPELATMVMNVIDTWSYADLNLACLLTSFLKADFEVAAAMIQGLTGSDSRRAAINAAAEAALDPTQLKMFQAAMKATKASRDRRNEYAHHLWGICPELPGALLLMDSKHLALLKAEIEWEIKEVAEARTESRPVRGLKMRGYDHSKIFVYRQKDIETDMNDAAEALRILTLLPLALLTNQPGRDPIRQELSSIPRYQQALDNLSSGSGS